MMVGLIGKSRDLRLRIPVLLPVRVPEGDGPPLGLICRVRGPSCGLATYSRALEVLEAWRMPRLSDPARLGAQSVGAGAEELPVV